MRSLNVHASSIVGSSVICAPTVRIGPNCLVDGNIKIGDNTSLAAGVVLVGDAEIGDDCVLEAGVSLTGVLAAGAQAHAGVVIGSGTFVGSGSVLARGVKVGSNVHIGVGAFISRDVPSHAIVAGNPAEIIGYDAHPMKATSFHGGHQNQFDPLTKQSIVEGVRFYRFPAISDARGDLTVGEFDENFPFRPMRYFTVYNVPSAAHRGEHAHRECQELLICLTGSVVVVVDDGERREEVELNDPGIGLYLPPMVWRLQYRYSAGCIMLVMASTFYDANDYIRDYDVFLAERLSAKR